MEKMIKKMMVAGLACLAMCGTAMARPVVGPSGSPSAKLPSKPSALQRISPKGPQAGRAPEPKRMVQQAPKPVMTHHPAAKPVLHTQPPQHHVAHHKPARRPVTPCHRHHRHECTDCHYDDNGWVELGAGIIGGIIGALIAG